MNVRYSVFLAKLMTSEDYLRRVTNLLKSPRNMLSTRRRRREDDLKELRDALGITPKTKKYNETAFECYLRALQFPENTLFIPTAIHMELISISDAHFEVTMQKREYQRYPGKFGLTASALCSLLRSYVPTQI